MRLSTRDVTTRVFWLSGLLALGIFVASSTTWPARAADEGCCKEGDTTPPTELVAKFPKGQLHSPYTDIAKVAEEGHTQFMRPGCNECHGGTGGGGICPALTQGAWFWGNTDDVLFRLSRLARPLWSSRAISD